MRRSGARLGRTSGVYQTPAPIASPGNVPSRDSEVFALRNPVHLLARGYVPNSGGAGRWRAASAPGGCSAAAARG